MEDALRRWPRALAIAAVVAAIALMVAVSAWAAGGSGASGPSAPAASPATPAFQPVQACLPATSVHSPALPQPPWGCPVRQGTVPRSRWPMPSICQT